MCPSLVSSTRSPIEMPSAAVSTYCTVPSSILMPRRRIGFVVAPAAADVGSTVIDSTRPKPVRIAVGVGTTTGAEAAGGTTTVPAGGAVGAGATTTGAGAGVTGSDVAQAASNASALNERGNASLVMETSCLRLQESSNPRSLLHRT